MKKELEQKENIFVSLPTVTAALKSMGLIVRTKKKKPGLTKDHKKRRLEFAKKYKHWTVSDWSKVIFSDETKVNLYGSDGIRYTWKRPGEQLSKRSMSQRKKFGGGGVMLWKMWCWLGMSRGWWDKFVNISTNFVR